MDCPGIPDLGYADFGHQLAAALGGRRVPLSAMIEITERCNLNCRHCYIGLPAADAGARRRELSAEQWYGILDQLAEEGTLWLRITGGEPLLRPDFRDIYTYAKSKGMLVTLFTNATLITPTLADFLYEWPPENVAVTLYGATEETYERVTGIPGSFARCMAGVELLHQRGVRLKLRTVLMTLNVHEYWAMRAWSQGLGVEFAHDPLVRPALAPDSSRAPTDLRITPEQAVELEKALPSASAEWHRLARDFWGRPGETLYACGAGVRSLHVAVDGMLYLCAMSREKGYDLMNGSLSEGWAEFLPRLRYQPFTKEFACRECEMSVLCARCPALAALENGDPESVVEYACQIAHLRAQTFLSS